MSNEHLIKKRILDMLANATPQNPVTIGHMAEQLGMFNKKDTTQWSIREKYIASLVKDDRYPIGSSSRGYFMMKSIDDLRVATGYLDSKVAGIRKRRSVVQAVFREYLLKPWPLDSIWLKP